MGIARSTAFVVPEGYVAVLREFSFNADPVLDLPCNEVLTTILVNDFPQDNYTNMELGSDISGTFIPCWILAREGQRIQLKYDNSAAAPALSVEVCVIFHGNLLLNTGVPIEYQIGNEMRPVPLIPSAATPLPSIPEVSKQIARGEAGMAMGRRAGGTTAARARARRPRPRRAMPIRRRTMSRAERQRADITRRGRGRY